MQRKMDLVREILFAVEKYQHGRFDSNLSIEGYSEEEIGYHIFIMGEAGLLAVSDETDDTSLSPQAVPEHLTWEGHDFLENSRDPSTWKQAKLMVNKTGGASLAIWSEVLKKIVLGNLGLE